MARLVPSIVVQPRRMLPKSPTSSSTAQVQKTESIRIVKRTRDLQWREFSVSSSVQEQYDWSTWQMYHRIVSSRLSKRQVDAVSEDESINSSLSSLGTSENKELSGDLEAEQDESKQLGEDEMMFTLDL